MKYDHVATITGVSGFVGSNLARALVTHPDYNIRVFGADLAPTPRLDDLADNPNFEFFDYDVHRPLRSDLLGVDTIYHFAGIADPKKYIDDPITVMKLNLGGLENILERTVLWSGHRPRIVYSSTSEVYAKNTEVPFREDESMMMFGQGMRWCYALSKATGEKYLQAYGEKHGFKYTIFRFFNFVGKDVDAPGAGRVITKMVGDALDKGKITVTAPGSQTRCFTYVDDFLEPLMNAGLYKGDAEYDRWSGVINLGSDEEVAMWDLATRIQKILHDDHEVETDITTRDGVEIYGKGYEDAARRVPDTQRAEQVLRWRAKMKLDDFLPDIVDAIVKKARHDAQVELQS